MPPDSVIPSGAGPLADLDDAERFIAFACCAADLLVEADDTMRVTFAAGAFQQVCRYDAETVPGQDLRELMTPLDRVLCEEMLYRMRSYRTLEEGRLRLRTASNRPSRPLPVTGYYLEELGRYFLTFRQRMPVGGVENVPTDPESGLLMADGFVSMASQRLAALNAAGERYQMSTVALTGADALRQRLDKPGLKRLKAAVGATLRANAANAELAADLGDDRFALIHRADMDLRALEERMSAQARRLDPQRQGLRAQATPVAAGGQERERDDTTVLIHSMRRMEAENVGGFGFDNLAENLSDMVRDTSAQLAEVRRIVKEAAFRVNFQPVVKLRSREPHHFECLVRFDVDGVDMSPGQFIKLAEEANLVQELDLGVVRRALEHLEGTKSTKSDLPLAVNLSGKSLSNRAFINAMEKLLDQHAGVRRRLLIEITDSGGLERSELARDFIRELRTEGHKVTLDDFGAGDTQIDSLQQLEIDFVKIDGSYIRDAQKSPKAKVMLRAITSLCREMRVATIAEMVEDELQVPFLRDCSILLGQGFLFGRPQPEPKAARATEAAGVSLLDAPVTGPTSGGGPLGAR